MAKWVIKAPTDAFPRRSPAYGVGSLEKGDLWTNFQCRLDSNYAYWPLGPFFYDDRIPVSVLKRIDRTCVRWVRSQPRGVAKQTSLLGARSRARRRSR